MCGIAGYHSISAPVSVRQVGAVARMCDAQAHRGPDDCGIFSDDHAVLGHRRLSILDLSSAGHQPMSTPDENVWVTFNGEIYNYPELKRQLALRGKIFASASDTEVLLHGYVEWGIEGLLERLAGMFAFAIYDRRYKRLVLARDRLGIKPLYYSQSADGRTVSFASEVRALGGSGLCPSDSDPLARAGFLLLGSVPGPRTTLKSIKSLLPGEYFQLDPGCARTKQYWDLRFPDPGCSGDAERGQVALEDMLQKVVTRHLLSDAPLGVFLSGGMDSAAIVALASRAIDRPLTTLTVKFSESKFDESANALSVARAFCTRHSEIHVTSGDFKRDLPAILSAMDQPTNDGVNTYYVSKAAHEAGLKVVLSGLGGDEVFWGYSHYRWMDGKWPWLRMLSTLPEGLRKAALAASGAWGKMRGQEKWVRLQQLQSDAHSAGVYFATRGFFPRETVCRLLGLASAEIKELADSCLRDTLPREMADRFDSNALNYLEIKRYLHDQLLRDADVFSMAHSIETRVPYLDHELVEYVATLPASVKLDHGANKPALVLAAPFAEVLAASARGKKGFTFPMRQWILANWDDVSEVAYQDSSLDRKETERALHAFRDGRLHWSRAWALVVLGSASMRSEVSCRTQA